MATLTNKTIASTYTSLLKLEGDTGSTVAGASGDAVQVKTGDNDATPLYLNTDRVGIGIASPTHQLTLGGDANTTIKLNTTGNSYITLDRASAARTATISFTTGDTVDASQWALGLVDSDVSGFDGDEFYISSGTGLDGTGAKFVLDANSRISLSNNDSGGTGGQASTSGNTILGYLAGNAISSGDVNNTIIGHESAKLLNDGDNNVVIGTGAMDATTASSDNIAIGRSALGGGNVTNGKAIAIGGDALQALTDGQNNVGIGYQSMSETTQGNYNTAIGYQAMYRDAGLANTHNTFVGQGIASGDWANNPSTSNTGVGSGVMQGAMDDATNNTGIGVDALNALVSGKNNVAIGHLSLKVNQSGSYNTAVGATSLDACTGGQNAAFGWASGGAVIGGTNNVLLGTNAGNNITTGSQNTCVGDTAITNAVGSTNQTVIGYGTTGKADNTFQLGNDSTLAWIFGNAPYHAWDAGNNWRSIQLGSTVALSCQSANAATGQLWLSNNVFYDDTDNRWEAQNTGESAAINMNDDGHISFYVSNGSDSADAEVAITTALKINNTGEVTMPLQPAVQAVANATSSNENIATSGTHTIVFDREVFDVGSDFTGNTFTAPVTGKYQVNFTTKLMNIDESATYIAIYITTDNRLYTHQYDNADLFDSDSAYHSINLSDLVDLDANDTLTMGIKQSGGTAQMDLEGDSGSSVTRLSVHLVC